MFYKHYFICGSCKTHLIERTDNPIPVISGPTHWRALEADAEPMTKGSPVGPTCMGVMTYCAGFDKFGNKCGGNHPKGTEQFQDPPPPPPNPEWDRFAAHVHAEWMIYVNSGYSMALRGPNHDRSFQTPAAASQVLQRAGGMVTIHGGLYKTSISLTTDASLKRNAGGHAVFIYHL